ncbi:NADH-quinone oxidoreductase subunit NuoE [Magnetococcus sp. PR-3]|uniref:NADH-quinone oxidoreductase subunit NuoE n=1 Tax=Magnetococcus sp. PR-3 TaxID=3120355 RepID=UPI002FCDE4DA
MSENAQAAKPAFTEEALKKVETIYNRYPEDQRQSALLPVLDLAQREFGGWLSRESMDYVAEIMELAPIRVYEVATFYTMYNLKPVGKHHVQVCTNISCWLCGSDGIGDAVKGRLEIDYGQSTDDGQFTLTEVECLGACVNAPMFQVNDDYYENLTPESAVKIIDELAAKA